MTFNVAMLFLKRGKFMIRNNWEFSSGYIYYSKERNSLFRFFPNGYVECYCPSSNELIDNQWELLR